MVKTSSNFSSQVSKGEPETPAIPNEVSQITSSTTIKGEIVSNGSMRIDGIVEGKISGTGHLTIGEKAVIKGDIECSTVDFSGTIVGNMYVSDVLCVKSTASVDGDINARKLHVELGASVNGTCHMFKSEEPAYRAEPEPKSVSDSE